MSSGRDLWTDDPRKVRRALRGLVAVCLVLLVAGVVAPWLFPDDYAHLHWEAEGWFFSYAVFGFLAFTALVALARLLAPILRRDGDDEGGDRR